MARVRGLTIIIPYLELGSERLIGYCLSVNKTAVEDSHFDDRLASMAQIFLERSITRPRKMRKAERIPDISTISKFEVVFWQ